MGGSARRRLSLAGATCALALAVPASGASGASAATPGNGLAGVACPSSTDCAAVGSHTSIAGAITPLAEQWNGNGWALRAVPLPPGAVAARLTAVACPSVSECEAVGSLTNGSGPTATLAEHFNGHNWSVRATPNASGAALTELNAVACNAANSCSAVGDGAGPVFSIHWNGASWTGRPFSPSAYATGTLSGITCYGTNPGECIAVGHTGSGATSADVRGALDWVPLGRRGDAAAGGHRQRTQRRVMLSRGLLPAGRLGRGHDGGADRPVPRQWPPQALARLRAVRRPSALLARGRQLHEDELRRGGAMRRRRCHRGRDPHAALRVVSNASQTPRMGSNATSASVLAVSCSSTTACTAVGRGTTSSVTTVTLAERWTGGTSWAIQPTQHPS